MSVFSRALRVATLFLGGICALSAAPKLRLVSTTVGPVSVNPGSNAAVQTVEAYNAGDQALNLQLTSSATWAVPALAAERPCTTREGNCRPINVTLNTSGLARGAQTAILTVSDPNALDAPQTITVTVNVGGNIPDSLSLYVAPGGSSEVKFSSNSNLVHTVSGGAWLNVSLDGSGTFRFVFPFRILARHVEGMGEGTYNATVTLSGSQVAAENKTIPVRLQVTSQPIISASPTEVTMRVAQGAANQPAFVTVTNNGLGNLSIGTLTPATTSGGNWLSAEVVPNTSLVMLTANVSGLSPGSYAGSVAIASNAVNGAQTIPVRLEVVAQAVPFAYYNRAVNTGALDPELAPGGAAAIFGEQLSLEAAAQPPAFPLPTELAGARVLVNDVAAPLYYTSYGQINFQVPYTTSPGEAIIRVERAGQRGNPITVRVSERAPRIIRTSIGDSGVIVNSDGSLAIPGGRPARPGEAITIYVVGLGQTSPGATAGAAAPADPLQRVVPAPKVVFGNAFMGAIPVEPLFVGLTPTLTGLYQVNVVVPTDFPQGDIALALEGDNYRSNTVIIPIRP